MYIIGITGGTGSGKTTIINEINKLVDSSKICFLSSDSYYKNNAKLNFNERDNLNYDTPDAIDFNLLIKHINMLKHGKGINVPNYCFSTHLRLENSTFLEHKKVLIIEGILILANEILREIIDYSIFLDCPREIRFKRRLERDIKERGRKYSDVVNLFENRLDEMHSKYVEPYKSECNLIINTNEKIYLNQLVDVIKKNLE